MQNTNNHPAIISSLKMHFIKKIIQHINYQFVVALIDKSN